MNSKIIKAGLDAGLLNYVDLETPRRYFICGNADLKEVENFAEEIIGEVLKVLDANAQLKSASTSITLLVDHFG
jgi:hypothetical protein